MRRYPRRFFSSRAVLFFEGKTHISETVQISEGGILIQSPVRLAIGELVVVHFTIPGHYIRAEGRVIYTIPARVTEPEKTGIRFTLLSDNERALLREFTAEKNKGS